MSSVYRVLTPKRDFEFGYWNDSARENPFSREEFVTITQDLDELIRRVDTITHQDLLVHVQGMEIPKQRVARPSAINEVEWSCAERVTYRFMPREGGMLRASFEQAHPHNIMLTGTGVSEPLAEKVLAHRHERGYDTYLNYDREGW